MALKVSGFSFIHNAYEGGYPLAEAVAAVRPYVDEIVIIDMQSTDGTRELLQRLGVRILDEPWGHEGNLRAFARHQECIGDIIIFFEADEVFNDKLLRQVKVEIQRGYYDLGIYRLQLEQNFQRCRWYPIPIHRIFPKGRGSYIEHPTKCPDYVWIIPSRYGFLWDISNCFRDNWMDRKRNQSTLFGVPRSLMVAEHFTEAVEIDIIQEMHRLGEPHWTWTETPFAIPDILKPLVGKTSYEPTI